MIPSKITREKALHTLDTRFRIGAVFCIAIAAVWGIYAFLFKLKSYSNMYVSAAFGLILAAAILYFFVACPLAQAIRRKQETVYEVSDKIVSKEELRKEIGQVLCADDMTISMNGDWIDFEFDSRKKFGRYAGIYSFLQYKKLILLCDDGTYKELDYYDHHVLQKAYRPSENGISIGLLKPKKLRYDISYTNENGNLGLKKHYLNALDLTNSVHKWLADHGYKRV